MLYKPSYCCSCGDRIERLEWNLLTNRRFCELCETEHRFDDLVRKFVGVALLTLGVFGFGSYLASPRQAVEIRNAKSNVGSAIVSKRKSESFEEAKIAEKANTQALKSVGYEETDSNRGSLSPRNSKPTAKDSPVPSEPKKRLQKVTSEPVYFCGATTKKGTPCSRRVKGGGRCWQHKGRKALLSEKELRIKN